MIGKSNGTGIGQAVRRLEDLRLVTGQGCYTDDLSLPGQVSVDDAAALALPGLIAVLNGKDWLAD